MSRIAITSFTKYELTEQEQIGGSLLTTEQKQFIQNEIAKSAELRLALEVDPSNYTHFVQQESYLKGQMDSLQYILDCSTASEELILAEARSKAGM